MINNNCFIIIIFFIISQFISCQGQTYNYMVKMGGSCLSSFNQLTYIQPIIEFTYQTPQSVSPRDQFIVVEREQLKKFPYKFVGAIICNKKRLGTGVLISKDLVLTAAHNFIGIQLSSLKARFYLPSMLPRRIQHQNGFQIEQIFYDKNFGIQKIVKQLTQKDVQFDYALLKLKLQNPQQAYNSQLQISVYCPTCNSQQMHHLSKKLSLFGFPSSHNNFDMQNFTLQVCGVNTIISIEEIKVQQTGLLPFAIGYRLKTAVGQSGASLLIDKKVIGIHCLGPNEQIITEKAKNTRKIGRLITVDVIQNLVKWCNQSKGHPFSLPNKIACTCIANLSKQLQIIQQKFLQKDQNLQITQSIIRVSQKIKKFISTSNVQQVKILMLSDNLLEKIDVSKYSSLTALTLNKNRLTRIDLKNNQNLVTLNLSQNKISSIDLSDNKKLQKLNINENQLQNLWMFYNKKLVQLSASENMINFIELNLKDINNFEMLIANQRSKSCIMIIFIQNDGSKYSDFSRKQKTDQFTSIFQKTYGRKGGLNQYSCNYTIQIKDTPNNDSSIRR